MTEWTEETLRKAASWKAFKEGKALWESGAVTEAKSGSTGYQGAVAGGRRPLRVTVVVRSASDLETRCPCPENQSTGALCGHAVAVGLAVLSGKSAKPAVAADAPQAQVAARPWRIVLPPNWRDALQRGRLPATLAIAETGEMTEADERLNGWLVREKVAAKAGITLSLAGAQTVEFLDAISEHPRVAAGKEGLAISVRSGGRIALEELRPAEGRLRLQPRKDAPGWSEIAGSFWQISSDQIVKLGSGRGVPPEVGTLGKLAAGAPCELDAADFISALDRWQDWLAVPEGGWLDSLHFVPASAGFELTLDGSLQQLEAKLRVHYEGAPAVVPGIGKVVGLPRVANDRCVIRNLPAEEAAVRRLESAGFVGTDPAAGSWSLRGESAIIEFLTRALPELRHRWTVHEGSRFGGVQKSVSVVTPKIEILGSGEDWLSFDLSFQTNDGALIPAEEMRRLLRSGRAAGKGSTGRSLVLSSEVSDLIEPLFAELDLRQENGRFIAKLGADEVIREICEKLDNSQKTNREKKIGKAELPATLRADLRPYQRQGFGWLQDRVLRFGGALLGDDMGLGKTLQTIALIESLFTREDSESGRVLVVATASLLGNWKAEFAKFAPSRRVHILHGSSRDHVREELGAGQVVITSYGTLARDLAWHLQQEYLAVVVDEASLMRNPDTDHAKAVAKLKARHRVALTGTPIENGVRDLWSIFRFVRPGWLGTREDFKNRYESELAAGSSSRAVMERLRLRVAPFFLRRTKDQVAPDLPTKLVIDEFCDLSSEQQSVYKQLLEEGRRRVEEMADAGNKGAARMRMLTALLRLRQTCCDLSLLGNEKFNQLLVSRRSAKLERLLELLEEAVSGSHRVLVFSQFQKQLLEIQKCVEERGWGCLRLDGQSRDRQKLVDRFQQADGPPVFLISLKAGGYGLNLTAADIVIHFDPWWNPAAEAQATDRTHRIGQTRPVTVYRLLTRGTVEEKVVRLQERKRDLASVIDEAGEGDPVSWAIEDFKSVLG